MVFLNPSASGGFAKSLTRLKNERLFASRQPCLLCCATDSSGRYRYFKILIPNTMAFTSFALFSVDQIGILDQEHGADRCSKWHI